MHPQIKITLRRRLPLVWLILLLVTAVLLPSKVWTALLIGLGSLFAIAYLWVWTLSRGLRGGRRLRFGWVAVGDRLSEQFELVNRCSLPALWVEVTDQGNVPGYQIGVVRSLGANAKDSWRQAAICQQRGQFTLGPWALHSADPFGIFHLSVSYPQAEEIVIHPPIHTQIPIPLPAGQSSGRARARERSWQATINAAGVRDYQDNDPFQWIHWPTTARKDSLYVRHFDLDAAGDVWLLLDLQATVQLGQGADGTEEHAVLLAASLAAQGLRQNRAVGLTGYGRKPQFIPPSRGKNQQWKILRALALVSADGDNPLSLALRDLSNAARRGSAAVVITASGSVDWLPELLHLSQRGIRSHVILLDRASFTGSVAKPDGASSQGLRTAVRQLGFECHLVRQGEVGRPAEEQQRRGFWEFKVTATGKVITVRSPLDNAKVHGS